MNYIDKYGMWHVKEVIDGEPSGNDSMIISAYAHSLGLEVDSSSIASMLLQCADINGYVIERFPGLKTPYPSRDFWLAHSYFFPDITLDMMKRTNWKFSPIALPKFNLIDLLKQVYNLRPSFTPLTPKDSKMGKFYLRHRNFYWENNYTQIYRFAFSVPLTDREAYYSKEKAPWYYRLISWIDSKLEAKSDSGALIRSLKYDTKPELEVYERYYKTEHPIYKEVRDGV